MKPTLIGFNGPTPYAIILWSGKYKTICYDKQELQEALERQTTPGDFFNSLEPSVHILEGGKIEQRTA